MWRRKPKHQQIVDDTRRMFSDHPQERGEEESL